MNARHLLRGSAPLLLSMLVLTTAGCSTSLTSTKVNNFNSFSKGQVYYLPRAEYQVTVSRELKKCTVAFDSDADAALSWLEDQFSASKSQDTDMQQLEFIKSILTDPILKNGDVKAPLEFLLSDTWPSQLVTRQEKKDPDESNATPEIVETVQRQVLDNFVKTIKEKKPALKLKFEAALSAQAVMALAPDTAKTYSLDYELMQSGLKGTDYSVEMYPNGTLKSVNVTIDDQTGTAIQSVLGGVAKLAAAAGGFPLQLPQTQSGATPPFQSFSDWKNLKKKNSDALSPCKPEIRLKIYQRAGLEAQAESNADEILAQTKMVDILDKAQVKSIAERDKAKAALKELNKDDPKYGEASALATKTQGDVKITTGKSLDAKATLAEMEQAANKVSSRLGALRKALTYTNTYTVRPKLKELSFTVGGEEEAMKNWLDEATLNSCAKNIPACAYLSDFRKAISAHVDIYAPEMPSGAEVEAVSSGVFYRQPLKSLLLVCKAAACVSDSKLTSVPEAILLSTTVDVPQLGALAVLPLNNAPFQNNTLGASFAESGALTKVTYKSNAAAAKAAEVFDSSAETVLKFKDAKRLQESTKLNASAAELDSRKKVIDAQLALEKSQADLDSFRDSQKRPVE